MKIIVPPKQSRSLIKLKSNAITAVDEPRDILWRVRDPNQVPRIRENFHQVSRIRENRIHASPYLVSTISLKKTAEECWAVLASVCFLKNKF